MLKMKQKKTKKKKQSKKKSEIGSPEWVKKETKIFK